MNTNSLSNFFFHGNEHDSIKYHLHLKVLTVNTNSLGNSLSWATGVISSTFLSSTLLWRKGISSHTSPSVSARVFLFSCLSTKASIVPSRRANLGTSSSILFLQNAAVVLLFTVMWSTIVRVSDWTMYFQSRSLFWLVGCVFRADFTRFFLCENLRMHEIKWVIDHLLLNQIICFYFLRHLQSNLVQQQVMYDSVNCPGAPFPEGPKRFLHP